MDEFVRSEVFEANLGAVDDENKRHTYKQYKEIKLWNIYAELQK